jgi:hypothetical protein
LQYFLRILQNMSEEYQNPASKINILIGISLRFCPFHVELFFMQFQGPKNKLR